MSRYTNDNDIIQTYALIQSLRKATGDGCGVDADLLHGKNSNEYLTEDVLLDREKNISKDGKYYIDRPDITLPNNNATNITNLSLTTTMFSPIPCLNVKQTGIYYQIATDRMFYGIVDSGLLYTNKNVVSIPHSNINDNTYYYIRVKHVSGRYYSPWSKHIKIRTGSLVTKDRISFYKHHRYRDNAPLIAPFFITDDYFSTGDTYQSTYWCIMDEYGNVVHEVDGNSNSQRSLVLPKGTLSRNRTYHMFVQMRGSVTTSPPEGMTFRTGNNINEFTTKAIFKDNAYVLDMARISNNEIALVGIKGDSDFTNLTTDASAIIFNTDTNTGARVETDGEVLTNVGGCGTIDDSSAALGDADYLYVVAASNDAGDTNVLYRLYLNGGVIFKIGSVLLGVIDRPKLVTNNEGSVIYILSTNSFQSVDKMGGTNNVVLQSSPSTNVPIAFVRAVDNDSLIAVYDDGNTYVYSIANNTWTYKTTMPVNPIGGCGTSLGTPICMDIDSKLYMYSLYDNIWITIDTDTHFKLQPKSNAYVPMTMSNDFNLYLTNGNIDNSLYKNNLPAIYVYGL